MGWGMFEEDNVVRGEEVELGMVFVRWCFE